MFNIYLARPWSLSPGLVGLAVAATLLSTVQARAAVWDPSPAAITAGGTVTLSLSETNISPNDIDLIGGADLALSFDTTLLSVTNVAADSLTSGWSVIFNSSPTGELISMTECLTCSDLTGTGAVFDVTFAALANDPTISTSISATNTDGGIAGEYQLAPTGDTINITAQSSSTPTPAPGLAVFFLPALALIKARVRRA